MDDAKVKCPCCGQWLLVSSYRSLRPVTTYAECTGTFGDDGTKAEIERLRAEVADLKARQLPHGSSCGRVRRPGESKEVRQFPT